MKQRLLYFFPKPSSFIQKDIDILSERYDVVSRSFLPSKKYLLPISFLSQFIFLLANTGSSSLIICRFAAYHSFLPALFGKIFRKPVLIIIGGMESHCFPSISYGNYTRKIYGWFTRQSMNMATHISPVDESLVECEYNYAEEKFMTQGYKPFCPKARAPYTVIYNGYDARLFYRKENIERKPDSFLTTALTIEGPEFFRKGIDLIFEVAKKSPQCTFTVIGKNDSVKRETIPTNVLLVSKVPYDKLIDYYNAHEFYFQLSMAEGFPNALCEAMLCECIPIGSSVFGIPKIIDGCGFVLKKKNPEMLFKLIDSALNCDRKTLAHKSRQHIIENFSLEIRREKIFRLVESLISNPK